MTKRNRITKIQKKAAKAFREALSHAFNAEWETFFKGCIDDIAVSVVCGDVSVHIGDAQVGYFDIERMVKRDIDEMGEAELLEEYEACFKRLLSYAQKHKSKLPLTH